MVYSIAVFGSCASRDNFYSVINPNYKKYFNCNASSQRGSLISLMQEPIPFKSQDIQILPENRLNNAGTTFIKQDLSKIFLDEIKETKPDYLLIDNYFEVTFGVLNFNKNQLITNNYWDLPKTEFYSQIGNNTKITMYNNPKKYLDLYEEHSDLFMDFLQKHSPDTHLILNPVRLGYKILKKDKSIEVNKKFKENAKNTNKLISKVDKVLKKHRKFTTLKIKNSKVLDEEHEWGLGQVHYTKQYYQNILEQLNKISNKSNNSFSLKIPKYFFIK